MTCSELLCMNPLTRSYWQFLSPLRRYIHSIVFKNVITCSMPGAKPDDPNENVDHLEDILKII